MYPVDATAHDWITVVVPKDNELPLKQIDDTNWPLTGVEHARVKVFAVEVQIDDVKYDAVGDKHGVQLKDPKEEYLFLF